MPNHRPIAPAMGALERTPPKQQAPRAAARYPSRRGDLPRIAALSRPQRAQDCGQTSWEIAITNAGKRKACQ